MNRGTFLERTVTVINPHGGLFTENHHHFFNLFHQSTQIPVLIAADDVDERKPRVLLPVPRRVQAVLGPHVTHGIAEIPASAKQTDPEVKTRSQALM